MLLSNDTTKTKELYILPFSYSFAFPYASSEPIPQELDPTPNSVSNLLLVTDNSIAVMLVHIMGDYPGIKGSVSPTLSSFFFPTLFH